ncbi:SDR family NAD(P)-dependent oxidoreductase [Streptomyces sp. NPDC046197]|uniref:SDR family NAD(P)-dependent oxidoreductase n=1 Tax=Streptomyces sp. NPDC046197 TaxID=3154337 RepID=UPI0033FAF470
MDDIRPLALVTGASSGIGYELAKQFAEHGYDLLINAEDDRLDHAAQLLRETGAEVRAVRADLRNPSGVDHLVASTTGLRVDVAALNAGVGRGGAFVDTDLADDLSVVELNVTSTVRLAKPLLRDMVARGAGRVVFTSSIAATMPGPFQAVYNASKSFVQSFAQALQDEVRDTGVTVTAFLPGPTDTDFFRRAGGDTEVGSDDKDDAAQVARQAFDAVTKGRTKQVTGSLKTKVQGAVNKVLPDSAKAAMHRRMAEPGGSGGPDEQR